MMQYVDVVKEICQLTDEMLGYSQGGEWAAVSEVEENRQALLIKLDQIQVSEFDREAEALLHAIIETNKEIELLSRQEMEDCRQNLVEAKNKKAR